MPGVRSLPFVLATLTTATVLGSAPQWATEAAPSGAALAACAAFVPYALLTLLAPPPTRAGLALLLLCGLGCGLALSRSPALLSDDVYRQRWDGKLLAHGVNPYDQAPESAALADLRDADSARIHNPSTPATEAPLAQALFALAYRLEPSVLGQRLLALCMHLGCALLVFVFVRHRADEFYAVRAATLVALNPLLLLECALNAHFDVATGACIVAFVWALQRPALAAGALGVASGLTFVSAALAPMLWRPSRALCLSAVALAALWLWPLAASHAGSDRAPCQPDGDPRATALPFALLESGARAAIDALATRIDAVPGQRADEMNVSALAPTIEALADTPFDLRPIARAEHKAPRPSFVLPRAHLAGLVARGLALALFASFVTGLLRRELSHSERVRLSLFGLLWLSPQWHPWALAWLLPLELALGRRSAVVWSAVALGAYTPIDHWLASRHWIEAPWLAVLTSAMLPCALWIEARAARSRAR